MKLAILQMSDTPQIESTAVMLRYAGYEVKVCGKPLRERLRQIGCDTVLAVSQMRALGYDPLEEGISEASVSDMLTCDLFVEIKVRNVEKITREWPRLKGKIAWWRVNGAQPEICPNGGNEVALVCPVITACLWYGTPRYYQDKGEKPRQAQSCLEHLANRPVALSDLRALSNSAQTGSNGMAYTFWPPYPRSAVYDSIERSRLVEFTDPFCICYNVKAWGYGEIIDQCVDLLGVKMFGNGSPAGQIPHSQVPSIVSTGKALVHLKSVDCPGWALYEAILGGCPVITGRLLNSRMLAYDLLEDGVTCLEFGVPASLEYGRGNVALSQCFEDITDALLRLGNPSENSRIGQAGKERLNRLMWNTERDGESFKEFMERWFM